VIARVSRAAGLMGGLAVLAITLLVSLDVLLRSFANRPLLFVDEVASLLQVLVVFGGLAYTFEAGGHVRVDLLTARLRPGLQAGLRLVTLALGLGFVLVVAWVTAQSALTAYRYGRVSAVMLYPLWIPMLIIPAGLLLLAAAMVVALARQWRAVRCRSGVDEEGPPPTGSR
jgi:TRAP-type C4-dicarboxylate transport system permease small subunit